MTSPQETKALAYHRFRLFFFFSGIAVHLTALYCLSRLRLPSALYENELGFFALVYAYLALVSLPLSYASGHWMEHAFGLSRQSLGGWAADHLKRTALSMAMFVFTAACFFAAVRLWPERWWLTLAIGWTALSAMLVTVFPVWIIPLFYKTRALADPRLRAELLGWCRSLGYDALDVREIAFSKKTSKANAALVGFGKTRRVILGDTLLQAFTPDEIRMVLTHEIGHHAEQHLLKGVLLDLALSFAAFGGLYLLRVPIASLAGVPDLADVRALPILSLLAAAGGLAWMPFRNAVSRHHEREADRYAFWHFPSERVFVSVMEKLAKTNLSHRSPARWETVLLATHPPIDQRIAAARAYFAGQPSC